MFPGTTLGKTKLFPSGPYIKSILCHAREIATIKLSFGCSCKAKSTGSSNIS